MVFMVIFMVPDLRSISSRRARKGARSACSADNPPYANSPLHNYPPTALCMTIPHSMFVIARIASIARIAANTCRMPTPQLPTDWFIFIFILGLSFLASKAWQNHKPCTTNPFLLYMFGKSGEHLIPFNVRKYLDETNGTMLFPQYFY